MVVSLPSRGLRGTAGGVLAGLISAVLFAVAYRDNHTLILVLVCFFVSYFTAVPLFIAGLGAGVVSSLAATIAAVAALSFVRPLAFPLMYAVLYGLPAAGLTAIALRPQDETAPRNAWSTIEDRLLMMITLYPCLIFLAVVAAMIGQKGGLLGFTTQMMTDMIAPLKGHVDSDMLKGFTNALAGIVRVAPALIGCCWMIVMLLSLILAQSTLKQQNWNLRPDFALLGITVPGWLLFAAAATGLLGLFAPAPFAYAGTNLSVMLCVPLFFVGLAVVHAWAATTRTKTAILILLYATLILFVWSSLLVTALGAFDQWFNFRRRLPAQRGG